MRHARSYLVAGIAALAVGAVAFAQTSVAPLEEAARPAAKSAAKEGKESRSVPKLAEKEAVQAAMNLAPAVAQVPADAAPATNGAEQVKPAGASQAKTE